MNGLSDIQEEVCNLSTIVVDGHEFTVNLYLGGDWKFLAVLCGIDAANAHYSCIWCKCPSNERYNNMEKAWSIIEVAQGAQAVDEISRLSKLPKGSKQRFNCSHIPLFPTIPLRFFFGLVTF